MVIKVENLGTLKTAETDLSKNLIVYSGKNNSGKTYMLNLVYGLMSFSNPSLTIYTQILNFPDYLSKLDQQHKISLNVWDFYERQGFKQQIITAYLKEFYENINNIFASTLPFLKLNIELNTNSNWQISELQQDISIERPFGNSWENGMISLKGNFELLFEIFPINNPTYKPSPQEVLKNRAKTLIRTVLFPTLYYSIFNFRLPNFFTSERVASLMFGKEIYKYNAQNNLQNFNFDTTKNNTYSKSLLKELEYINNFDIYRTRLSDYGYLADELETLIGGKISANQDGLLLFKEGRTSHLVTNSSSTVKSLATLVFYLRHTAQKGDCIMIDEPELSLHPDNQRKIARFLARCVNEGFKVIISTHSDYIINEINNLITLHKHKNTNRTKSLMKKYDYKDNQTLDYQQVGAYLFKDNHCAKIEVGETGFSVETIDEAMGNLYKASDSIFLNSEVENTKLEPSNNNKDE